MSVDWRGLFPRAALIASLLIAGCIDRTLDNGTATYRAAWWVMAVLAAGGAILIVAARFVPTRTDGWYRYTRKIRWGLISSGVIAVFLIAVMYFQKVTVSPDRFTAHVGFFGEKSHQVNFRDLERVELVKEVSGIGRSRHTNYFFVCLGKDGTSDKVPISGSCMQAALPQIVEALQASRVPIINSVPAE